MSVFRLLLKEKRAAQCTSKYVWRGSTKRHTLSMGRGGVGGVHQASSFTLFFKMDSKIPSIKKCHLVCSFTDSKLKTEQKMTAKCIVFVSYFTQLNTVVTELLKV